MRYTRPAHPINLKPIAPPVENQDYISGWLSAIIDGEGSVSLCDSFSRSRKKFRRKIAIRVVHNTCLQVIKQAKYYLDILGVHHCTTMIVRIGNRKPLYRVDVCEQASIEKLAAVVRLTIPAKKQNLRLILEYIRRPKPPWLNVETLADLYFQKNLTLRGMCNHFGLHHGYASYISTILRKAGHRLRPAHRPRNCIHRSPVAQNPNVATK